MRKLRELKYELLEHPNYSPDFVPYKRNFWLRYVLVAADGYIADLPKNIFQRWNPLIRERLDKVHLNKGQLIKKIIEFLELKNIILKF